MPTSPIDRARRRRQQRVAGFTLVELMVVIVILGLATTAVIITLPDGRSQVRDDAEGLAARLVAARDLAIVSGRDSGVTIDAAGYGFSARGGRTWEPQAGRALGPRRWAAGTEAQVAVEGGPRLVFDSTGVATPATIVLRREGAEARIAVDGAGAVRIDAR